MHLYTPRMGIESQIIKAPAADRLADEIAKTLEDIKNNLKKAQNHMKVQADKKWSKVPVYAINDLV